jgi:AcrR family transcriptional regulator
MAMALARAVPRDKKLTRDEKKARTRERLLDAAADVFARRGFQAASLDEVADEAGLTKGAVYSNFKSKDDLIVALIETRLDHRFIGIATAVDRGGDLHHQASQTGRAYVRLLEEARESYLLSVEFSVHLARHPQLRRKFARRYRDLQASYARLIEDYAASAGFSLPLPAAEMTVIYFAVVEGLAIAKLAQPEAVPDDLFAKALELIAATWVPTGTRR